MKSEKIAAFIAATTLFVAVPSLRALNSEADTSPTTTSTTPTTQTIPLTPELIPTIVTTTTVPKPAWARCSQWWDLALEVGFPADTLPVLDRLMWRESRCRPNSHYLPDPNGGSRGLLQINGSWTGWLRRGGVLQNVEELFDPRTNLEAALRIYHYGLERHGWPWGPWYYYQDEKLTSIAGY